jgi:hypothetical protein
MVSAGVDAVGSLSSEAVQQPTGGWTLAHRIAFRFAFSYFALFIFPFPIDSIPKLGDKLDELVAKPFMALNMWVGHHVFGLKTIFHGMTGSSDTTLSWINVLTSLVLAVVATIAWSILDRRRAEYRRLWYWLRTALRFWLCLTMLGYGFSKVFKTQFPAPTPGRLVERYGDSSPMALLWTFMGYSTPYTVFAGLAEVVGGLLLFFRRTTLLGALVVGAVMTNVVMLNFCYDVCVKIFSAQILVVAIVIAAPELRKLVDLLVRNRATAPSDLGPSFSRRVTIAGWAAKTLLVVYSMYLLVKGELATREMLSNPKRPAGLWIVDDGMPNVEMLNLTAYNAFVMNRDGSVVRYALEIDRKKDKLTFMRFDDQDDKAVLAYETPDPDHLVLSGHFFDAGDVAIHVHFKDTSQMYLNRRGFHLINETSDNR